MGLTGLEPVTLRLSSACSNQLSYRPRCAAGADEFSNFDCRFSNEFRGASRGFLIKSTIENRKSKMTWRQGDSNP